MLPCLFIVGCILGSIGFYIQLQYLNHTMLNPKYRASTSGRAAESKITKGWLNGTLRAEFEISAQSASAAWHPAHCLSLRQPRLPNWWDQRSLKMSERVTKHFCGFSGINGSFIKFPGNQKMSPAWQCQGPGLARPWKFLCGNLASTGLLPGKIK